MKSFTLKCARQITFFFAVVIIVILRDAAGQIPLLHLACDPFCMNEVPGQFFYYAFLQGFKVNDAGAEAILQFSEVLFGPCLLPI